MHPFTRFRPVALTLIALWLLIASFMLLAADLDLTWTYPTANVDGSAVPATGAGSIIVAKCA